jgi:hypothetical protein
LRVLVFQTNPKFGKRAKRVKITAAFYLPLTVGIIFAFGKTAPSAAKICIDFILSFSYFNMG